MSQQPMCSKKDCCSRATLKIVFAVVLTLAALNYQVAFASAFPPSGYRASVAGDKFSDTWQVAAVFELPAPRHIRARKLELVVGTTSTSNEVRPFVSLGPVWRLPLSRRRTFLELGFSPTFFAGSTFHNRNIGGNFHFTSSAAIGVLLGVNDDSSISLRIQHTSNGGLDSTNPGMDMVGINIAINFAR